MNMKAYKQKGAALFISLVLLFLMTIIGLNALDNATSDERMALNIQHQQEVFHAAESAINLIKRDDRAIFNIVAAGVGNANVPAVTFSNQPNVIANATGSYVGCSRPPPGYELIWAHHDTDIISTAQLATSGARTTIRQGIARVASKRACP